MWKKTESFPIGKKTLRRFFLTRGDGDPKLEGSGAEGMKVLVTGGSGFLGRRAKRRFEELGWQVLAPGHRELDITDGEAVREWFRANRPEAAVHTAAVSDTGVCQQRPAWSEKINVDGTVNIAEACRETGAKLIFCSSDQVYFGSTVPGPHRENEDVVPGNVYGCQKLRAERRCLEILPETVCLRLSWMYARDSFPGEHGHFLATLKAALEEEALPLSWPVYDRRGLTDVSDVTGALTRALVLPGGIWNFGSGNDRNTFDTVKAVLEALGHSRGLERLTPNRTAFADAPRDITMDLSGLEAQGIRFPKTEDALLRALKDGA